MRSVNWVTVGLLALAACDDGVSVGEVMDAQIDAAIGDMATMDAARDAAPLDAGLDAAVDAAVDAGPDRSGETVEIDLAPYVADIPDGAGMARVFVSTEAGDLVGGPAATGVLGDWIMQNDQTRFVIEADRRVIGPCPYGGTVIDGDVRRGGPEAGQDVIGESCLLLHLSQTLKPDRYEVINDGTDGGAAILAVTGHLELLDFININGLLRGFGLPIRLGYETEVLLPLTVTEYFILRPGDSGVRVVTALRNDGREAVHTPIGHLLDSGGDVDFFNPAGPFGGFGYRGLSPQALQAEPLVMLGFVGASSSYAYVPDPDASLDFDFPRAGSYVTVSGVAVSLLGNDNVLPTLIAQPNTHPTLGGILHLEPGAQSTHARWMLVAGEDPADLIDSAWQAIGQPTGVVRGTAAAGVTVSAVDAQGRTVGQSRADADGAYRMRVPPGEVTVRGYAAGRAPVVVPGVVVVADAEIEQALDMGAESAIVVQIRRPDGTPSAGKITVLCEGDCPNAPTANDEDVGIDGPLDGAAAVIFAGMDGAARIPVAPGQYRVSVSRGITWSTWPADAVTTGGALIDLAEGGEAQIDAEIAAVVDTTGALSADFHVHGINSPDAPVANPTRVRTFLAEGVDVLVATDHDFVTDYGPEIIAEGAEAELASIVGVELTTFSYGHYNGFPLQRDAASPDGGAFDWAGGPGPNKSPAEIFDWFEAQPGTQVIQVNHPGGGYFGSVGARPLAGISLADPTDFRLPAVEPDPVTGDTGLWDEGFTAFEVFNGLGRGGFWEIGRWWFQMLGRGFTPTATAVSDTHKTIATQAGTPRSFVFTDQAIGDFDPDALAQASNAGRLVGSSGPFFNVRVVQGEASAGLGETLAGAPGQVQIEVAIQAPEWMQITGVDVFANITEGLDADEANPSSDPLPATASAAVDWDQAERVEVAPGHARRQQTVTVPLDVAADTWIVVVVHGDGGRSMFPVIHRRSARPFGFSNPVYVDVDGGGFNNPPLANMAKMSRLRKHRPRGHTHRGPERVVQPRDLPELLEWIAETHGHDAHGH